MNLNAQWIVGFVDGKGCFDIQINKTHSGFQVLCEFVISQHKSDLHVLNALKQYFKAGVIRNESSRPNETGRQYRVRDLYALAKIIVPFFEKHSLKTLKKVNFLKFRDVVLMIERKEHLTPEGLEKIRKIKASMNQGAPQETNPGFEGNINKDQKESNS